MHLGGAFSNYDAKTQDFYVGILFFFLYPRESWLGQWSVLITVTGVARLRAQI